MEMITFKFPGLRYDEDGEPRIDPETVIEIKTPLDQALSGPVAYAEEDPEIGANEGGTTSLQYKARRKRKK
jgi:hypothetical protein